MLCKTQFHFATKSFNQIRHPFLLAPIILDDQSIGNSFWVYNAAELFYKLKAPELEGSA